LGQQVSLRTVAALSAGLRRNGTLPIGYAAVYGVGHDEWPTWQHAALLDPHGRPHSLADFLQLVDPADPAWLAHFRADLKRAAQAGGFAGFHLDQYGFPRRAVRPDGRVVELAEAFDALIRTVREELPDACLVFNNVNDFPVWASSRSPQDVTYTEVWEPHDTLADLAAVATRSRALAPDRPAVLAAYQSVYATRPDGADDATRLTMATLFSHGATQLLAGEDGRLLVDPYYVRNHPASESTLDMLARWHDLLVAAGDVLMAQESADVTRSVVGGLNAELDVVAGVDVAGVDIAGVDVSHEARPGAIWRRVVQTPVGIVVHLINLAAQAETGWDTPKAAITAVDGLRLRIRQTGTAIPRLHAADPDRGVGFTPVSWVAEDGYLHADLPPLHAWQILLIRHTDIEEK
jgi:dextranase